MVSQYTIQKRKFRHSSFIFLAPGIAVSLKSR